MSGANLNINSIVKTLYTQGKSQIQEPRASKASLVWKLTVSFLLETFSFASMRTNFNYLYSKITRGSLPAESAKVYEYTSKIFTLLKCPNLSQDQRALLTEIAFIKAIDKTYAEALEDAILKVFSDPKLNPQSSLDIQPDNVATYFSIPAKEFPEITKDEAIKKALGVFSYQMDGADLNYQTLKEFKKKTRGFPEIQARLDSLEKLLEEKAIQTFATDIHRDAYQFKLGDIVINTQVKSLDADQDLTADQEAKFHEMCRKESHGIFDQIKQHYIACGKTPYEASELASVCLLAASQAGLGKPQTAVSRRLEALFSNFGSFSARKIPGANLKEIVINPTGFKITEKRPYEFQINRDFVISLAFDCKQTNICDGKTVKASFQNTQFRTDLFLKKLRETLGITPKRFFDAFRKIVAQGALNPDFITKYFDIKSCSMMIENHVENNPIQKQEIVGFSYLDDELKRYYGFDDAQISTLMKNPENHLKKKLTFQDLSKLPLELQAAAKLRFKNKVLEACRLDIHRDGLNAVIQGERIHFPRGQNITEEQSIALFDKVFAVCLDAGLDENKALDQTYFILLSTTQQLGNYCSDRPVLNAIQALNVSAGLSEEFAMFIPTAGNLESLDVQLNLRRDAEGKLMCQIERDIHQEAKLFSCDQRIMTQRNIPALETMKIPFRMKGVLKIEGDAISLQTGPSTI